MAILIHIILIFIGALIGNIIEIEFNIEIYDNNPITDTFISWIFGWVFALLCCLLKGDDKIENENVKKEDSYKTIIISQEKKDLINKKKNLIIKDFYDEDSLTQAIRQYEKDCSK